MATAILNKDATLKIIASIGKRSLKLQADIHQAALSAIVHHEEHGDTTLINRLLVALPKSQRRHAVAAWAMKHDVRLALNDNKETKAEQPLVHVKAEGKINVAAADAEPFYELKAKEGDDSFAFDTWLSSITGNLNRALGKATDEAQKARIAAALAALAVAE